jgi:hypothetical protein
MRGSLITFRLDPEQARKTAGWVYFEMGVPDTVALNELAERLERLDVEHGPVVRTPIGWLLPGVVDPDGHEMRFYVCCLTGQPPGVVDQRVITGDGVDILGRDLFGQRCRWCR